MLNPKETPSNPEVPVINPIVNEESAREYTQTKISSSDIIFCKVFFTITEK